MIKKYDYRVYGWIEDILTDEEGKKHYLVCFGFLVNHNKLEHILFPHPNTIRKKHATVTVERKVSEKTQSVKKQLADQFIERFIEVAYSDKIPEILRKPFGGVINVFCGCSEYFSKEAFTVEQARMLFSALETFCHQIVALNEMEPGSEQQLELVQNIIQLLSKLDVETEIYQLVILPLLNAMQSFERSLFGNEVIEEKTGFEVISDKEKVAEEEVAKQLISQMLKSSEQVDDHVDRLEKILKTDVQNPSSTQVQSLEEKTSNKDQITEINIEPENTTFNI